MNYHQKYATDPKPVRILVGIVWLLELLHVILISHALYHYTISLFGSVLAMITEHVVWSLVTQVLVAAMSGIIVKCCFILVEETRSLLQLFHLSSWLNSDSLLHSLSQHTSWRVSSTCRISGYAVASTFYLLKLRTGYREPDSLLNRLTGYAINTGVLTSMMSLLTLVL
ncbi:hypothetical protein C8R42DRAFT_653809, partial [Lentinula raphanica]